jgi:hypothetical protein
VIKDTALGKLIRDAGEGELILAGTLLPGLDDEQIAWVVMENVSAADERRITLHAYVYDIFVVSKVVYVHKKNFSVRWGATEVKR